MLNMSVRDISDSRADFECLKENNYFFLFFQIEIFIPPRLGGVQNMSVWDTSVFFMKAHIQWDEISFVFQPSTCQDRLPEVNEAFFQIHTGICALR